MILRHIILSLCLFSGAALGAGEASVPEEDLSPAAKRAITNAEESIGKARNAFKAAAAKEQDRLLTALQREQEVQTRAGKLEAALAVKAMVERVRSGEFAKDLEARAAEVLDDPLGEKAAGPASPLAQLTGVWHMGFNNDWRRLIRIEADGKVNVLRSNNVPQGSTYTLRWEPKTSRFVSEGLGNMIEVYRVEGGRLACDHWCDGSKFPAERPSLTAVVDRAQMPERGPLIRD